MLSHITHALDYYFYFS